MWYDTALKIMSILIICSAVLLVNLFKNNRSTTIKMAVAAKLILFLSLATVFYNVREWDERYHYMVMDEEWIQKQLTVANDSEKIQLRLNSWLASRSLRRYNDLYVGNYSSKKFSGNIIIEYKVSKGLFSSDTTLVSKDYSITDLGPNEKRKIDDFITSGEISDWEYQIVGANWKDVN